MASVQQKGRRRRLMGEINVVPYIDVMLVLLIIFMITAPLLTEGIKVELPKAQARGMSPEMLKDVKPIILSIDERGRLFLNYNDPEDRPLDAATVEAQTSAVLRRAPETAVLVRGDYRVAYGEIVAAMTILQRAGAQKVGFVTQPADRANDRRNDGKKK
jgi:biopolymer transport protein TolR